MAEPLTPERIANFRETMRLHGANKETVQLPFGTFVQFLDAAEQATTLRAENERLREALGHLNAQLGDQLERMNRLNAAQDRIIAKLDAALAEGGAA